MKRVLPIPTDGGGTVSIEVDDGELAGPVMRGSGASTVLEKSAQNFEAAIASTRPAALALVEQFANLTAGTKSVRVKFGIKLTAAAGAIIASAGSEANFEVEVLWERPPNH